MFHGHEFMVMRHLMGLSHTNLDCPGLILSTTVLYSVHVICSRPSILNKIVDQLVPHCYEAVSGSWGKDHVESLAQTLS